MSGNTLGKLFSVTTCGESHGAALAAIVDGCPPGVSLTEEMLQKDLDRRKPGQSRYTTQRREDDQVRIISGVFEGKTTGTPIGLIIENTDQRSKDYGNIKDRFRPGHADFTYQQKYGLRDYRGGGRSSARETAMRVAAGAIARQVLQQQGIQVFGWLSQIGDVQVDWQPGQVVNDLPISEEGRSRAPEGSEAPIIFANSNPFFCPDPSKVTEFEALIDSIRREGDSIGAKINVCATGVPVGLGEPVFDRLDADLAHAMMSINAVKGVEVGDGFGVVEQRGSQHRDEMLAGEGFTSNHAGGVLGGISSGQPITVAMALKPTSSITVPGKTVNLDGETVDVITKGRHDPCVGIRAVPIAEAMMSIVLLDHLLRWQGQCGTPAL